MIKTESRGRLFHSVSAGVLPQSSCVITSDSASVYSRSLQTAQGLNSKHLLTDVQLSAGICKSSSVRLKQWDNMKQYWSHRGRKTREGLSLPEETSLCVKSRRTNRLKRCTEKAETRCYGSTVQKHAGRNRVQLKLIKSGLKSFRQLRFVSVYQHTPFDTCKSGLPAEK